MSVAPSMVMQAVEPSTRIAEIIVVVRQWPCGQLATSRSPPRRATAQAGHVCFGSRLVEEDEEDELCRIEPTLLPTPPAPGLRDVGPVLFGRMECLFLYVRSIAAKTY